MPYANFNNRDHKNNDKKEYIDELGNKISESRSNIHKNLTK